MSSPSFGQALIATTYVPVKRLNNFKFEAILTKYEALVDNQPERVAINLLLS